MRKHKDCTGPRHCGERGCPWSHASAPRGRKRTRESVGQEVLKPWLEYIANGPGRGVCSMIASTADLGEQTQPRVRWGLEDHLRMVFTDGYIEGYRAAQAKQSQTRQKGKR